MFGMEEEFVVTLLSWIMIISGVGTAAALLMGQVAGYGKFSNGNELSVPPQIAWVIQESPAFLFGVYYLLKAETTQGFLILALFVTHYTNRTFIYTYLMKSKNGSPWYIVLSAVVFCLWNGYIQGASHAKFYIQTPNFLFSPCFLLGVATFFTGMYINIQSDSILRNLRAPGETGYKIPRGGMFEYVTSANYFGEIIEWIGYAIASGNISSFAFAFFTIANIGPRALQHHEYYKKKFPNYPKERKALIPFLI